MKIELSDYSYGGTWVESEKYPGVRFLIRPQPQSLKVLNLRSGGLIVSGEESFKRLDYCWTKVEGLDLTISGEEATLNSQTKKAIFDFDIAGIPGFLLEEINKLEAREVAVQGN
jgi:hypothetical protein